jgi:outer membrane protein assembly factor BamB
MELVPMKCLRPALALALAFTVSPVVASAAVTADTVSELVQQWQFDSPAGVTGGPLLVDGTLYVASWNSTIYALDPATGAQKWTRSVGGPVVGAVVPTDDGGICYGTLGAQVGCLHAGDGSVRWQTSLTEPAPGAVWSAVAVANGRLFVGIASVSDSPCTRGRLVALDLADGHELWRFYTVPEKVCTTDTEQECDVDGECPGGGTCVDGRGGGVTATVALDPTGEWVYMNTVGCYTFPSIGESDSMFKIRASDGDVTWRTRVNDPEQFGFCREDSSIDCGMHEHCAGVGGTCSYAESPSVPKGNYHDFGFLNGPLLLDLPAEGPDPAQSFVVSASKNGTIYWFDPATGDVVHQRAVQPTPITPGFAGFGLFNGAITYADGRLHAALYNLFPFNLCDNGLHESCSDDADCNGGTCVHEPEHLMAFDARTGATEWSEEIGRSWSSVGVSGGVVYSGHNGDGDFFAHDAAAGTLLRTFELPTASSARALVAGDQLFIAFGITSAGGVQAYGLCGNGTVDAGETCDPGVEGTLCCSAACTLAAAGTACGTDDGNVCTASTCDAGGQCVASDVDGACDDGDACSNGDACAAGVCVGSFDTVEEASCALGALEQAPCGDEALPRSLERLISKRMKRARKLLAKAGEQAAGGHADKATRLRTQALKQIDAVSRKAARAATAGSESRNITEECHGTIDAMVTARRHYVEGLSF